MPDQDVVVAITADNGNMQAELDAIWDHLLPAFQSKLLPEDAAAQQKLREAGSNLTAHLKSAGKWELDTSWATPPTLPQLTARTPNPFDGQASLDKGTQRTLSLCITNDDDSIPGEVACSVNCVPRFEVTERSPCRDR